MHKLLVEQQISTVSTIHRGKEESVMETLCFLLMCLIVLLALVIVLVVLLHNGKFVFSLGTKNKKDELLLKAEHQHIGK